MADAAYLETPLRQFKGVGPRREQALRKIGVEKVEDLLLRLPFRYEDRTSFAPVAAVSDGERVTVAGELINCRLRWTGRRGFKVFEAVVRDESGCLLAVWPNQPYRQNTVRPHTRAILHGPVVRYRGVLQLSNPDIENLDEDAPGRPAAACAVATLDESRTTIRVLGNDPARYQIEHPDRTVRARS